MLLIAAAIVAVIYTSLYFNIDIYELLGRKAGLEATLIVADEILNVKSELERIPTIDLYADDDQLLADVDRFARFVRRTYLARGREAATVSLLAITPQVVADETMTLNVSVFNQALEPLSDVKVIFSADPANPQTADSLPDQSIWNTSFTFSTATDVDWAVTLFYKTRRWGIFNETTALPIRLGERLRVLSANVVIGA
jgi:hypothetical protein